MYDAGTTLSTTTITKKSQGIPRAEPDCQVMTGDCLHILPGLPKNSVDVVVTSPPYNIGVRYKTYTDNLPRSLYLEWLKQVAMELNRVLKDNGSIFLNMGANGSDPWISMDVASIFRDIFSLQNRITWVKSISIDGHTSGHFKPINSRRYLNNTHEDIYHFTKNGNVELDRLAIGVPYQDKSNVTRWGSAKDDKRCDGNTWFIPYKTVQSRDQKFNHPAGFPEELAARCIKLHGKRHGVVLDPFLGTGTTLLAAKRLGLHGRGIEIDPDYADIARTRIANR